MDRGCDGGNGNNGGVASDDITMRKVFTMFAKHCGWKPSEVLDMPRRVAQEILLGLIESEVEYFSRWATFLGGKPKKGKGRTTGETNNTASFDTSDPSLEAKLRNFGR